MSIVKSAKGKDQLQLDGYRYQRANNSQCIWCYFRNDCAGHVRFDDGKYNKITDYIYAPNPDETISMEFEANINLGAAISHGPLTYY
jgi:hypothetical protein